MKNRKFCIEIFLILLFIYNIQEVESLVNKETEKNIDEENISNDNKNIISDYLNSFFNIYKKENFDLYYEGFKILMNDLYNIFNNDMKYKKYQIIEIENNHNFSEVKLNNKIENNISINLFTPKNLTRRLEIIDDTNYYFENIYLVDFVENCAFKKFILANVTDKNDCDPSNAKCIPYNITEIYPFCICPVTSDCFKITKDVICKFKELSANNIDLIQNIDTFYYEYFNKNQLKYENKEIHYKAKLKCHNRYNINTTQNFKIKNDRQNFTILEENFQKFNLTKGFDYFIDDENITLYEIPDFQILMKFYDMKSILPNIKIVYQIDKNSIKEIIKGNEEIKWTVNLDNLNETSSYYINHPKNLLAGGRLFYEMKIFDAKNFSISTFNYIGSIDYGNNYNKNILLENSNSSNKIIFVLMIVIIFTILFLFFLYRKYYNKNKLGILNQNMTELMLKEK